MTNAERVLVSSLEVEEARRSQQAALLALADQTLAHHFTKEDLRQALKLLEALGAKSVMNGESVAWRPDPEQYPDWLRNRPGEQLTTVRTVSVEGCGCSCSGSRHRRGPSHHGDALGYTGDNDQSLGTATKEGGKA